MFAEKTIARIEALCKGMMFDCHSCGQCVLRKTGLICPMSCPKGLRNGPCGGTINERCEVYPDKQCVHVRIHKRTAKGETNCPELIPSPDCRLFNTSSYLNLLNGKDKQAREPLADLSLPENRVDLPAQTESLLEGALKSGRFVRTTEVRSPRSTNVSHVEKTVREIKGHFDAVNATAFLNGKPSLPSPQTAFELLKMGMEPIAQSTCRDHTKTSFVSEVIQNKHNGIHTQLCLTGDSYTGNPKIKQVFDMDSTLMLYEARHLRETGRIHFTGEKLKNPPKPFLGTAINPFTTPDYVPIRRLKQKVAAGADFCQTQMIFDYERFAAFMNRVCSEGIDRNLFLLAGVPVVISAKALSMLPQIPGIHLPDSILKQFTEAEDLQKVGLDFAKDLVKKLSQTPGVHGVHLMLMGSDHSVLPEVVSVLK